jgi:holin-like protein
MTPSESQALRPSPTAVTMPIAILILIGCQLVGELVREACALPIPGPVIGMFLLAAILVCRTNTSAAKPIPQPLTSVAETLIAHMGLLFVPAGVGIIAEAGLLQKEWLPIMVALVGSTVLSVAVTGLVMHWISAPSAATKPATAPIIAMQEGHP